MRGSFSNNLRNNNWSKFLIHSNNGIHCIYLFLVLVPPLPVSLVRTRFPVEVHKEVPSEPDVEGRSEEHQESLEPGPQGKEGGTVRQSTRVRRAPIWFVPGGWGAAVLVERERGERDIAGVQSFVLAPAPTNELSEQLSPRLGSWVNRHVERTAEWILCQYFTFIVWLYSEHD